MQQDSKYNIFRTYVFFSGFYTCINIYRCFTSDWNYIIEFHDKEIAKVDSNHTCVAVISLNSSPKERQKLILAIVF